MDFGENEITSMKRIVNTRNRPESSGDEWTSGVVAEAEREKWSASKGSSTTTPEGNFKEPHPRGTSWRCTWLWTLDCWSHRNARQIERR